MRRLVLILLSVLFFAITVEAQPSSNLYRTTLIQAAPGRLLQLIDHLKLRFSAETGIGEPPTWMIRHSQGDAWDLLLLTPIGSYEYFSEKRTGLRQKALADAGVNPDFSFEIAKQEDVFVHGPAMEDVRQAMLTQGFFHVEMFVALPGLQRDLRRQRHMENGYLRELGRPQNMIFTRDMGAGWDSFTIGAYRDLKHYAESADIPAEKQEAAARSAGFQSAAHIGPYLRTLIRSHHDTLGTAVR